MTFTKFSMIIALCGILKDTECFDYCKMKECQPRDHTMCKYPANKPDCNVVKVGLDDDQRKELLKVHNEFRQKVAQGNEEGQPSAANMMKLKWNNEAEDIAQRWSERCKPNHDTCRNMKDGTRAGQNAAQLPLNIEEATRSTIVVECVRKWYAEVKYMETDVITKFDSVYGKEGKVIGHYTALVSSNTTQVGCGYVEQEVYHGKYQDIILICNYVPSGNVVSMPVYKVGTACSECPKGSRCSKRYPGLCTNEKDEYKDIPKRGLAISLHPSSSLLVVIFFAQICCFENFLLKMII